MITVICSQSISPFSADRVVSVVFVFVVVVVVVIVVVVVASSFHSCFPRVWHMGEQAMLGA